MAKSLSTKRFRQEADQFLGRWIPSDVKQSVFHMLPIGKKLLPWKRGSRRP